MNTNNEYNNLDDHTNELNKTESETNKTNDLETKVNKETKNYSTSKLGLFLADTSLAHIVFTPICAFNEYVLAGIDGEEVLKARAIGLIVGTVTTRAYTCFADKLLKWCDVNEQSSSTKKYLIEIIGGHIIHAPIYTGLLKFSGASWEEIAIALPATIAMGTLTTRPFRYALNKWRKYWGLKPALDE
ncbi:hypothetical protein COV11_03100 [Candidatus Woesearchaeota archaeon CG10_big_fil_rev_8_21_14_0_10_30_7]|nr:MAG: hypothetical protein COV11_03100 [Candidatus Woesearchaeota archaeon CG10_big_fil_rev_8_21_14_0_10_30_7]